MTEIALCIALVSLIVSVATLYITQLRPPRINLILGTTVGVNYQDDGFSFYVHLTFNNPAPRSGLVNLCSLVFSRDVNSPTSHYIEWTEFRKKDDNNTYVRDEFARPLLIQGHSSVSKLVHFFWKKEDITFTEGCYYLKIFAWLGNDDKPSIRQKHEFFLNVEECAKLAEHKEKNKKANLIEWIVIDKKIEPNKLLTNHELKKLLG